MQLLYSKIKRGTTMSIINGDRAMYHKDPHRVRQMNKPINQKPVVNVFVEKKRVPVKTYTTDGTVVELNRTPIITDKK